jgi:inorganic phosphate transporter, PiT family
MEAVLIAGAAFLAFSNGANDNFKGFATVWGSQTLTYRRALTLATVAFATRAGLPISTTHALIGGLVGAGFAAQGGSLDLANLGGAFLLPLLVSPFVAATLGALAYGLFGRRLYGVDCACLVPDSEVTDGSRVLAARQTAGRIWWSLRIKNAIGPPLRSCAFPCLGC